jgi:hypothetical protein
MSGMGRPQAGSNAGAGALVYLTAGGQSAGMTAKESTNA